MIYSSNPLESSFILSNCAMEGVDKSVGSFVLSLGATINMDGVAIYLGATPVFMATCCGIDRIIDMGRTVMSVTSDASCAVVTQKITQKPKKDEGEGLLRLAFAIDEAEGPAGVFEYFLVAEESFQLYLSV